MTEAEPITSGRRRRPGSAAAKSAAQSLADDAQDHGFVVTLNCRGLLPRQHDAGRTFLRCAYIERLAGTKALAMTGIRGRHLAIGRAVAGRRAAVVQLEHPHA